MKTALTDQWIASSYSIGLVYVPNARIEQRAQYTDDGGQEGEGLCPITHLSYSNEDAIVSLRLLASALDSWQCHVKEQGKVGG